MGFLSSLFAPGFWKRPEKSGVGAMAIVLAYMAWEMHGGWVFPIDHATLAIHEGGHVVFRLFGERAVVYGGSFMQVFFPLVFCWHFAKRREALGFCFSLAWDGTAWHALGAYVGDARERLLPLTVPNGEGHDWAEILGRWNLMEHDKFLGGMCYMAAWAMLILCAALLARMWRSGEAP